MGPRDSVRVTTEADLAEPAAPRRGPGPGGRALALARNLWRQLTSMRTALVLLFLLALASLPGALLPQWSLNSGKTAQYILDHPTIGPILDRLGFFRVFSSPWYAAIYLLLFVSLVGCLVPRSVEFAGQWRAKPVATPRNLARLPHHAVAQTDETPAVAAERIRIALHRKGFGGWRVAVRSEPDGSLAISAERGYLREVGNLVFHFALLGLLVSVAAGSLFGYAASVIVTQGDGFCSTPVAYDNFRPGTLVDGTDMAPFCVNVEQFTATYTDAGQATSFSAQLQVQSGSEIGTDAWQPHTVEVNDPLRISGQRLYLLGHGYSPTFEITYPNGETRSYAAPFQPTDSLFTSQGVVKVTDPPGFTGDAIRQHQLAVVGIFAPSGVVNDDGTLSSAYPEPLDPRVAVEVYRGDLGMEGGRAQSVFAIDTNQVTLGLLVSQGQADLSVGESMTLDDGTKITFTGAQPWVSLQTSYDPAQGGALISAIFLVAGLLTSLTIRRRRVWYRIRPAAPGSGTGTAGRGSGPGPGGPGPGADPGGRTLIDIGGLARTDQAGYGAEFSSLVALASVTGDRANGKD